MTFPVTSPSRRARLVELFFRIAGVKDAVRPGVDIRALRRKYEKIDRRRTTLPRDVVRSAVTAGSVSAEWIEPRESRPERVLMYLHGGGFAFRFPNMHGRFVARLARALGTRALAVDYRLAPEHPFPTGSDDCLAAYTWLLGQGIAPHDVILAGDSAGGNLTLVTLLRAKAAGLPLPGCAIALSPIVDATLSSRSIVENEASDVLFRLASFVSLRSQYAPGEQLLHPWVSPLFGDLTGLPPILLQAGAREMLRDDSVRFAERARAAHVEVDLEVWPGMQHCFQLLELIPESAPAIESIARFVARHAAEPARERGSLGKVA